MNGLWRLHPPQKEARCLSAPGLMLRNLAIGSLTWVRAGGHATLTRVAFLWRLSKASSVYSGRKAAPQGKALVVQCISLSSFDRARYVPLNHASHQDCRRDRAHSCLIWSRHTCRSWRRRGCCRKENSAISDRLAKIRKEGNV